MGGFGEGARREFQEQASRVITKRCCKQLLFIVSMFFVLWDCLTLVISIMQVGFATFGAHEAV